MKKRLPYIIAAGIFLVCGGVFFLYQRNLVYRECYVEAGTEVQLEDFLKKESTEATYDEKSDEINIRKPGDYTVRVKIGFLSHKCILHVVDSVAPTAEKVKVNIMINETCEATDFVSNIVDETETKVEFAESPDFTRSGKQEVKVRIVDLGGNETIIASELFISRVKSEIAVEIGAGVPTLNDFIIEGNEAYFINDISELDLSHPATYVIRINVDGEVYKTKINVVDTISPVLVLREVEDFLFVPKIPEEFVQVADDNTNIILSFLEEPDVDYCGKQEVCIQAEDEGGNKTIQKTYLTLQEDTEPPKIEGVRNLVAVLGKSISYKNGIKVTDNCQEGVQLEVDSSAVNLNQEGSYPVTYTATDLAGNETSISATVTVKVNLYSEEDVYALADAALAGIITPQMAEMDKLSAIFNYIRSHVSYVNTSEKGDWLKSAYYGFTKGKGDCYVYASMAKVLLTRAGIANVDIHKIPAKTSHYWNLVDIGNGWYHFDTTPRKDKTVIFMWTDQQLMEYSDSHHNSHLYDKSLFPQIN